MTARRAAGLAMAAGVLAPVLTVASLRDDGDPAGSGSGDQWLLGLVVLLAPLICAAMTRSVAGTTLLRPVGGGAAVAATVVGLLHVAVAVDDRGALGLVYGSAAAACAVLVVVAVALGPEERPAGETTQPNRDGGTSAAAAVDGPPLDVITPLRDARGHAAKSVAAWVIALVVAVAVSPAVFIALGWPEVDRSIDTRVVAVLEEGDRAAVTFVGLDDGRTLRWTRVVDDSGWEVGDRRVMFIGDDGRVHTDHQFGLAGVPLFMPVFLVTVFGAFALRRLWGLAVALSDVAVSGDPPRLGYVSVIHDPTPKTWRPLVAVWDRDPTGDSRLPRPDAVYRADDETGEHLQCHAPQAVVRRAWIDTGPWPGSKPRWIGVEDGVVVPHRRSLFGRWFVRAITRGWNIQPLVELHHRPPEPPVTAGPVTRPRSRHALPGMVAWRLVAVVAGIAFAFVAGDGGERVQFEEAATAAPASAAVG